MTEKQKINTRAKEYFRNLSRTFDAYVGIKQPDLFNWENFYMIYSPKKFTLKPREDIVLDLKLNIATSKELDPWISLLPTLKTNGLAIVKKTWNAKENNWTAFAKSELLLYRKSEKRTMHRFYFSAWWIKYRYN